MPPGVRLALLVVLTWLTCAALPACKKKPPGAPDAVPDYAGTWTGTYAVTGCTNTGVFATAAFCAQVLSTSAQVTFTLTQTDRSVSGTFLLGSLTFSAFTTSVADDGSMTMSAAGTDPAFPIAASWTLRQQTPGTLTGQTHQVWKATGQSGEGIVDGQLASATR